MTSSRPSANDDEPSPVTWYLAIFGVGVSILYLANPTWGVFEFIPDNIPGIGNIDETLFTTILIASLARLGINVIPGLHARRRHDTIVDPPQAKPENDD